MKPNLPGYQIDSLIGEGVCGSVWAAEDPMGNEVAVRAFDALAINLEHVREVARRLDGYTSEGHGPVPIWMQALDLKPALQVMPLIAERLEGQVVPRSLQVLLADYLATSEAEPLIKCLAKALAGLHRRKVVHGNLKPGNIFISEEGRVQVGDYGLGWMPDIDFLDFSDAVLYMSPEQLEAPEGLRRDAGYQWDVYSFGVLAYRLLEGRFPRCHESFQDVAPAAGVLHQEGIEVDYQAVAEQLREEGEGVSWQSDPDPLLKSLVERCLALSPDDRFHDMIELCEFWEREAMALRHHAEMEVIGRRLNRMRSAKQGFLWGLVASLVLALGLLAVWQTREARLREDRQAALDGQSRAIAEAEDALHGRKDAETSRLLAESALSEAEETVQVLDDNRRQLLEWALAEGGDGLPVLIGREGRLALLDQQYQSLLEEDEGIASLAKWREQWQIERARVALAGEDWSSARDIVQGRLEVLGARGLTTLLLRESAESEGVEEELLLARSLAKKASETDRPWLEAILDLVAVRNLERQGKRDRSLKLLAELGSGISKLPAGESGTTSLWRTRLQREAADIAEGAGREALATEFRAEMVSDLRNELGAADAVGDLQNELEEQFIIASEGLAERLYAEGDLAAAKELSQEALALIPESGHLRVRIAQAVHHAVLAGCWREQGKLAEAELELAAAMDLLSNSSSTTPHERWRLYREGMVKWQLAGVMGQAGNSEKEVELALEALQTMHSLLEGEAVRPSPIQTHHVIGYLAGDLARTFEKLGDTTSAQEQIDTAIASWQFLCKSNPSEPEYAAGLAWCEKLLENS